LADIVVIVPEDLADGFLLGGARVRCASDAAQARSLLLASLGDPEAGIVGVADVFYGQLDPPARRAIDSS
jgi:hypothetical protein